MFNWNNKKFIKASVPIFFHIHLPPMIGIRVTKMMKLAEDAKGIAEDKEDILLLFKNPNTFKSELLLSVTGTVPNAQNTTLSGTYFSKVFEGPFNSVPKFRKHMDVFLAQEGKKAKDCYVHYAYCPKCAKKKGQNYMVLFAELQ